MVQQQLIAAVEQTEEVTASVMDVSGVRCTTDGWLDALHDGAQLEELFGTESNGGRRGAGGFLVVVRGG